jgi:hypothetical protein
LSKFKAWEEAQKKIKYIWQFYNFSVPRF